MIARRRFVVGLAGVISMTVGAWRRMGAIASVHGFKTCPLAVPDAVPVSFRIHGWKESGLDEPNEIDPDVVAIYIDGSWRAAWR